MPKFMNLTGEVFGDWIVIRRATDYRPGFVHWECRCRCGAVRLVRACSLRNGVSTGCGCRAAAATKLRNIAFRKHGKRNDPIYWVWRAMMQRCYDPKNRGYANYGGRGITVDERWHSFVNFYADMGDPPIGRSIDRRDNEKGYSADNCRWATKGEQASNRRSSLPITFGTRTMTVAEWAREIGIDASAIRRRLAKGCPVEVALSPLRHHRWRPLAK